MLFRWTSGGHGLLMLSIIDGIIHGNSSRGCLWESAPVSLMVYVVKILWKEKNTTLHGAVPLVCHFPLFLFLVHQESAVFKYDLFCAHERPCVTKVYLYEHGTTLSLYKPTFWLQLWCCIKGLRSNSCIVQVGPLHIFSCFCGFCPEPSYFPTNWILHIKLS